MKEKHNKLRQALQFQGLVPSAYWFSTWLWYMLLSMTNSMLYVGCMMLFDLVAFRDISYPLFIGFIVVWCHAQACIGVLLCAIFQRSGLLGILARVTAVALGIMGTAMYDTAHTLSGWILWIPIFSYLQTLVFVLQSAYSDTMDLVWKPMLILGVSSTMLFIIGVFFMEVVPVQGGMAPMLYKALAMCTKTKNRWRGLVSDSDPDVAHDPDVDAEQARVRRQRAFGEDTELEGVAEEDGLTQASAVRIVGVSKVYPSRGTAPAKLALKNVTMGFEFGECFGLLGPNGAGKSTLSNCIASVLPTTLGSIAVAGYDCRADASSVHLQLGVCPQDDRVWDDLRTREHLQLFARVKGVPFAEENALVQQIAEKVGLDGDALDKPASQLSVGMRRRLSLGIALLGDPPVLLLDEPTTGLDPATRQSIWRILKSVQVGKCILLCTHSMDEADTLCSRIGIIAGGQLSAIGSPTHLKAVYGSGCVRAGLSFSVCVSSFVSHQLPTQAQHGGRTH
jgi:ABC-type multidrug transport system ATPase subunit